MRINNSLVVERKPIRVTIPKFIFPSMSRAAKRGWFMFISSMACGEFAIYASTNHWHIGSFWIWNASLYAVFGGLILLVALMEKF